MSPFWVCNFDDGYPPACENEMMMARSKVECGDISSPSRIYIKFDTDITWPCGAETGSRNFQITLIFRKYIVQLDYNQLIYLLSTNIHDTIISPKMKRPYECKYMDCDKKFTTRFSLRRHISTHAPAKQYICVICYKKFALGQYLKEHTYIHTGQKPFKCPYEGCTKAFRQAGKLSLHKKLH